MVLCIPVDTLHPLECVQEVGTWHHKQPQTNPEESQNACTHALIIMNTSILILTLLNTHDLVLVQGTRDGPTRSIPNTMAVSRGSADQSRGGPGGRVSMGGGAAGVVSGCASTLSAEGWAGGRAAADGSTSAP